LLGTLWRLIPRLYAVTVMVVVLWLSYRALAYLVVSLFAPAQAPSQITGIPTRLGAEVLRSRRADWRGVAASDFSRVPPSRYHRLAGWIQPDRFNGCTQTGCHNPFPHDRRREVRAFLNMHATSLHCGVCHLDVTDQPLHTVWYDLGNGRRRDPPALFGLYGWLTSPAGRERLAAPGSAEQKDLVRWLRSAAAEGDNEPTLLRLAEHLAAVRPASEEFQELVAATLEALPTRFRGEYGAKLALVDKASGRPLRTHPGSEVAVRRYLRESNGADEQRRKELLAAVHPLRRARPLHCTDCHRTERPLLDFAGAGYPPARVEMLTRPVVFRMIERIADGQPFYLPTFVPSIESDRDTPANVPH